MNSNLLVISGLPATGKTTIARDLSHMLKIPLIARDDIKETLFDTLGIGDREWSRKLGGASFAILFQLVESYTKVGKSIIAESHFHGEQDRLKFFSLAQKYNVNIIEIHCHSDELIRLERFKQRVESGNRHLGHVDHLNYETQQQTNRNLEKTGPLCINDNVITVNTTDTGTIDLEQLTGRIRLLY